MMNYDKAVAEMLSVDGALAAAVVDFSSGMMLAGGVHLRLIWKLLPQVILR